MNGACTGAVDAAVYGALAAVAAIAIALQSLLALLSLQQGTNLKATIDSEVSGAANRARAVRAGWWNFGGHLVLNLVALGVSVAVAAAWWKVGETPAAEDQWQFWLPCQAVFVAAVLLVGPAAVGLYKMAAAGRSSV